MKQIQPAQGGGGGGSMFSKYSGEQINQIPEGYVQAMGQSPIAALISSGLQGFQMGQNMQMAEKKMGLEERQVKASETSATAAAAKATSEEGKLALLTEGKAIEGQAAADKAAIEGRKLELEYLQSGHKGFTEEGSALIATLDKLRGSEAYKKGDKAAKAEESKILARQITVATRLSEFNDKIAAGATPAPAARYQLPSSVSMTPNDPIAKKYAKHSSDYAADVDLYNRAPGVALIPRSPLQAANEFKGQLSPDELKRLSRYSNPFGK